LAISDRKIRAKKELRQAIIEAATKVFVEEGYEKTSLRSIAESIEYSPATIYLYFKDKNELLFAVHNVAFEKFFLKMAPLLLVHDPVDRIREMGNLYLDFAFQNPELYGLMFIDAAPMDSLDSTKECWESGMQTFGLLKTTIKQCQDQGRMAAGDIEVHTMAIWSFVHGLASLAIRDRFKTLKVEENEIDIEANMRQSIELMLNMWTK
jgi:AcrR family transcriptional regulator